MKHLILEGNQLSNSQQICCAQHITKVSFPCLTSLTLRYGNYSTFLNEILLEQKFALLYIRLSDAIIDENDAIALQTYLQREDCPLQMFVLESKIRYCVQFRYSDLPIFAQIFCSTSPKRSL